MTDDHLAMQAQPGADEPMLAVAMSGLVQVHEIHVDFIVGNIHIVLSGKMAEWFLQSGQSIDPHFRRRESMAPGYDTSAIIVIICFFNNCGDFFV